jgi:soluble lytic murein transglycosylase-like protein
MPQDVRPLVIPLFGQNTDHSSVPARIRTAVARSGGPGRPSGRRASALPLTAVSTMAALRFLRVALCIVALLAASMLSGGVARAGQVSLPKHRVIALAADPLAAFVTEASRRFAVPERWIRAVMRVESGGNSRARSRKGAIGLMQIMPGTWTELRARHRLGADPYDIRDNILAGTAYIRELSDRYGAPGFLAAYNTGPGRYERHLVTGRPLPAETQAYVAKLAPDIENTRTTMQVTAVGKSFAWANSPLFAARAESVVRDVRSSIGMHKSRSSRTHSAVDVSALAPQAGNLFVRLARGVRSQ